MTNKGKENENHAVVEGDREPADEAQSNVVPIQAPTPLEPVDLEKFRLSQAFHEGGAVELLTNVPVRKPGKEWFFRTHLDDENWQPWAIIDLRESGETYLLSEDVAAALRDEAEATLRKVYLPMSVNMQGGVFLWPLTISERHNDWNDSALQAAELAKGLWIKLAPDLSQGRYRVHKAMNQEKPPLWPDKTYTEVVMLGFRDRMITTLDHAVLRRLRGDV